MHVSRNDEVEFVEFGRNFGVNEVDGGVDDDNFGFVFGQMSDKFGIDSIEVGGHDVTVFVVAAEDGAGAMVGTIELIIFWGLGEAEDIGVLVLVGEVIQDGNTTNAVDGIDERLVLFGEPAALPREEVFVSGVFAVELVIAEADENGGDFAELL